MIYDAFGIWGIASYLASHRVSFDLKIGLLQKKNQKGREWGGGHTFLKKPLEFLVFLL